MTNFRVKLAAIILAIIAAELPLAAQQSAVLGEGMTVREVLSTLVSHSEDPASVRILLNNGTSYGGFVSSCDLSKSVCTVQQQDQTSTVVNIDSISAVTIVRPGSAKIALQGNRIFREPQDEVLSSLELKRKFQKLQSQDTLAIKSQITDDQIAIADCRFYWNKIVDAVDAAVRSADSSTSAKPAFNKWPNGIIVTHQADANVAVRPGDGAIAVQFDCTAPLKADFQQVLAAGINSLL